MEDLEEFRYPFESALEFFGSYWRNVEALHLGFAWIALLIIASSVLFRRKPLGPKLLALWFGLTMFNNPAFQFIPGATLGDVFGVGCLVYYIAVVVLKRGLKFRVSPIGSAILCGALVMALHALLIAAVYPALNADGAGVTRVLVIFKIFVFGACCLLFEDSVSGEQDCRWLIRQVVNFAIIGVIAYGIQIAVLFTGHIPYGTFMDAGYVGFPSFGSVSIERGHLGKFMTVLFPLFLLSAIKQRRRLAFFSFALVTLVNFSASSLSYFCFYLVHTTIHYRKKFLKARYAAMAFAGFVCLSVFVTFTSSLWGGLLNKVNNQAVEGGGGRGLGLLITYLTHYPLGLSYGGSSLRTPPGLDEMNSGLYSFIAQESLLAVPLICAFLWLVYKSLKACRRIPDLYVRRALQTGILIMPFIFFGDLLWFVPTIWLPMMLVHRLSASLVHPMPRTAGRRQVEILSDRPMQLVVLGGLEGGNHG
jgi:hypothetical protein